MEDGGNIIGYGQLLGNIKLRIRQARYDALKSVNIELIRLYRDIGGIVYEQQKEEKWGKSLVERLAADIRKEFPGIKGFSARNIRYMRSFYLAYLNNEKMQLLAAELSWSHNIIIIERCKENAEREFYVNMAVRFRWSKNILLHQIEGKAYERTLVGQTNFKHTLYTDTLNKYDLQVKDEYTFDFLDLTSDYNERQLENAILAKIEHFLLEMGGVFTFIGSQYRLEVSDKEYFIDLLLYHRRLRSLVAIELKVGEFMPEYVGKMQFYLAVLDDKERIGGESPSIGIIICRTKDKTIVEYALKESNKPIGVAAYHITSSLPEELRNELPAPEQIARLL